MACKDDSESDLEIACSYKELPTATAINSNALIPLHRENFWVYSDSLWENGVFQSEKSTLLTIEKVYELDGLKSIQFSSILPQLTLKNDTLFSTQLTPAQNSPNCYQLLYPMFFETTDTVQVDRMPSRKFVFKSTAAIQTTVGTFSDNIILKEEEVFEIATNKQVGIVKISFFAFNSTNQKIKRRTLTLKDFDLN